YRQTIRVQVIDGQIVASEQSDDLAGGLCGKIEACCNSQVSAGFYNDVAPERGQRRVADRNVGTLIRIDDGEPGWRGGRDDLIIVGTRKRDRQIARIEQYDPRNAMRSTNIDGARKCKRVLTGNFYKTAIAAVLTSGGRYR